MEINKKFKDFLYHIRLNINIYDKKDILWEWVESSNRIPNSWKYIVEEWAFKYSTIEYISRQTGLSKYGVMQRFIGACKQLREYREIERLAAMIYSEINDLYEQRKNIEDQMKVMMKEKFGNFKGIPIENADLSIRANTFLKSIGVNDLYELSKKNMSWLLELKNKRRNIGDKTIKEILDKMDNYGLIIPE